MGIGIRLKLGNAGSGHGLTTFLCHNFFYYSLPFKVIALTTALRHYMAGPLFKSRLRPWNENGKNSELTAWG